MELLKYQILDLKKLLDEITKDSSTEDIVENLVRRINKNFDNSLNERDIYEALIYIMILLGLSKEEQIKPSKY